MTDDRSSDLLSALPRSRPHRRSAKRPTREVPGPEAEAERATEQSQTAAKPARARTTRRKGKSARPETKSRSRAAKPSKPRAQSAKTSKPRSESARPSKPAATSTSAIGSAGEAQARPSRRSKRLAQPAQPRGVPQTKQGERPEPSTEFPVLRTAIQAAAELTEIGVTLSGKALRRAIGRFPRP